MPTGYISDKFHRFMESFNISSVLVGAVLHKMIHYHPELMNDGHKFSLQYIIRAPAEKVFAKQSAY